MTSEPNGLDADRPPTWLKRSLRRAGRTARFYKEAADALPASAGGFLLLLLPGAVLVALSADVLAFLFGGIVRAMVSWTAIFLLVGVVFGIVIGGESVYIAPTVMGLTGLLMGVVLGLLCGRIFKGMPDHFDGIGK